MRQALHDAVNGRFLGVQLLTHKAYDLSRSTMTRLHPTGAGISLQRLNLAALWRPASRPISESLIRTEMLFSISKRDRIEKKKSLAG